MARSADDHRAAVTAEPLVDSRRDGPRAADRGARARGRPRARSGRDRRPRVRRPRRRAGEPLLLRPRRRAPTGTTSRPRRSRTGAVALVVERPLELDVPQLVVADARAAMAVAADEFFGRPTEELQVAGVTGTNGKTTTAFLLYAILAAAGRRPGLLGTIESRVGGERRPAVRTTPEAIDLQRELPRDARRRRSQLRDRGDLARLGARPARPRALRARSCSRT